MPRAWWRTLGGAAVVASAVAIVVTGCSTGVHTGAPPSAPASRTATAGMRTPVLVPQPAAVGDPNEVLVPAPSPPAPRCRPLVHYAARNAGPLFCTDGSDNPAALRYFATLHLKIMQLPAGARQYQAIAAICADMRHISEGAEYSAYLLAATAEHWYFTGIAKVHGALRRLCQPSTASPSPSPSPSPSG